MSRLTLRLPETLHEQLTEHAEREGISLNQYIVYALTRQTTPAYAVQLNSDTDIKHQHNAFNTLREQLGRASQNEIQSILDDREQVK